MAATDRPTLLPPVPEGVPLEMRKLRRWAPWRAEWNPRANKGKGKWVKIPHRAARPEFGLSNKNATGWVSFEEAMAAYQAHPDKFAGIGYLMTGPHGVTGIDLDHCVHDGQVDDWAAEIAAKFDSYTEISPSGTGLHIMVAGEVPADWMNHDQGIEVYGGNDARFLCVTGRSLPGTRGHLLPAPREMMAELAARYRKAEKAKADVEDLHLPDLIPTELLPDLTDLDLPPHASNFLAEGPDLGRDRSSQIFSTAIELFKAGLQRDEVLSIFEANEYAMEIALDHRRQDYDKAVRYLWKEHCRAAEARAKQLREEALGVFDEESDGEVVSAQPSPEAGPSLADDFDDLDASDNRHVDLAPVKLPRFAPIRPDQFLLRKPMQWLVRDVLPRAGLAVIYGASGAGKTFLTLDLVAAISRGVDWRGKRVSAGRGAYIVAEGAEGFRNRLQAYCEFHGVEPADLAVGVIPDAPNLMDKLQVKELIEGLKTFGKLDYVVVDTYARVMVGGNENDAKDAGTMVAHCARIHKATGAIVILVHHSGKDAASGARGSSALRAAADVEIEVTRTREYRAAKVAKMKDGDDSGEFRFNLDTIELGMNEDGDPITSCVIKHRDDQPGRIEPTGLKGHAATVYATLATLLDLGGDLTYAAAIEACAAQLPHDPTKRDRRRDLVTQALDALVAKSMVRTKGGLVYLQ